MKYKLLKDLPEIKKGAISSDYGNDKIIFYFDNHSANNSDDGYVYSEKEIKNNPEWFAKVLFLTVDGYVITEGETYYAIDPDTGEFVKSIADENSVKLDWKKYKYCISGKIEVLSYNLAADILEELYEQDEILRGGTIYTVRFDGEVFNNEAERLVKVIKKVILNYFEK